MPALTLTVSLIGEHFPAALIKEQKAFFCVDLSTTATLPQQALNRHPNCISHAPGST